MIWVSWRQQRTETLIVAAIIALLAVLLVPTGIEMANAYHRDGLSSCTGGPNTSDGCGAAIQAFTSRFDAIAGLTAWFTLIPGLIGVLLAAAFVVELENGTYRLAWTQSITRGRWIATKLAAAIVAALVAALVSTLLITWWRAPRVHLQGRMETSVFDFEGTVAAGYVLLALGLALAIGAVWRRTVPALIIAFVGYIAARIFVDTWLRQRYQAALTATWREAVVGGGGHRRIGAPPEGLNHAWVISEYPSDKFGHRIAVLPGRCVQLGTTHADAIKCLAHQGAVYSHAVYQPAGRFWLFQGIETTGFAGTAIILIAFSAWWTHHRTP